MADENAKAEAMRKVGRALKELSQDETAYLNELKIQINNAVKNDAELDKQMEFCYGVIFAPDKIKNPGLQSACRKYISIVEGDQA